MATTTIQTISILKVAKSAPAYQTKAGNLEGAGSFQGFLQKSAQSEKNVQPQSERNVEKSSAEEAISSADAKKAEPKRKDMTDSGTEAEAKTSEPQKQEVTETLPADEEKKLQEFVENVRKILGLSAEELQMWLNVSGMKATDLLDSGKMQNFFMQVKGMDVSGLLTDKSRSEELKNLLAAVDQAGSMMKELTAKEPAIDFEKVMKEAFALPAETETHAMQTTDTQAAIPEMQSGTDSGISFENKPKTSGTHDSPEVRMELPSGAASVFEKVVQSQEQIRVTPQGLEQVVTTVSAKDIYEQIVTKFTAVNLEGTSKVTMQLNPEHLGKIAFQVVSREGQVSGQFVAENEAVKAALEAQVSQLKLHLIQQGIRVDDVKVLVGDTANYFTEDRPKEQNHESGKKRARRLQDGLSVTAVEEEAAVEVEEVSIPTGTIDFTA